MNQSPLVTVVVPTYKRADRLGIALRSILGQTYSNLEVLVVNDNVLGSEYDLATESKLAELMAQDSRLRVVHTSGRIGGGAARNFAGDARRPRLCAGEGRHERPGDSRA